MFTNEHAGGIRPWIFVGAASTLPAFGAACSSSTKTSSSATTAAPTTTGTTVAATTTSATTAVPTTTSLTPAARGTAHGTNIALVISTANGLVSAIDDADATAISTSCSALSRNNKALLQPIPAPPGEATAKVFDQAKDEICLAQKDCSGGLIRKADLATAALEAKTGAALVRQVLDANGRLAVLTERRAEPPL
jgi:hypothetical protein